MFLLFSKFYSTYFFTPGGKRTVCWSYFGVLIDLPMMFWYVMLLIWSIRALVELHCSIPAVWRICHFDLSNCITESFYFNLPKWFGISNIYAVLVPVSGDPRESESAYPYYRSSEHKREGTGLRGQSLLRAWNPLSFIYLWKHSHWLVLLGAFFSKAACSSSINFWWSVELRSEKNLSWKREWYWSWNNGFCLLLFEC